MFVKPLALLFSNVFASFSAVKGGNQSAVKGGNQARSPYLCD
jgi:hypothetical protein